MARIIPGTAAFLAVVLYSFVASAGVYTDDLSKCLVKSSSSTDQAMLVQWMFAMISLNPAVKPLSSVTATQRDSYNRQMVELMQRLMFNDCRKEAVEAIKYEGSSAVEAGFQVLGQVAARGLMSDPKVAAGMQGFASDMDRDKWNELSKEAGVATPVAPPAAPAK